MIKKEEKEKSKESARKQLAKFLKPGDTVYTVLRHVSQSGMSRNISLYVARNKDMINISGLTSSITERKWQDDDSVKIGGCGMDMGFALVYDLSGCLFPDGFKCIGEKCPGNEHFNNVETDFHKNGGYALRQAWR